MDPPQQQGKQQQQQQQKKDPARLIQKKASGLFSFLSSGLSSVEAAQREEIIREEERLTKMHNIVEETLVNNIHLRKKQSHNCILLFLTSFWFFTEQALSSMGEECNSLMEYTKKLESLLKEAKIEYPKREDK